MSVEDQAATVKTFIEGVVDRFGVTATTTTRIEDNYIFVEVEGEDLGLLIGQRGATLEALQELARTVIQHRSDEQTGRVILDVAGFRAKRSAALAEFVQRVADEVKSTDVAQALEPMTAADRKIVHDTVNVIDGVVTTSEGVDPRRYVVIRPESAES
jgi:spoIIIJ-associated protein